MLQNTGRFCRQIKSLFEGEWEQDLLASDYHLLLQSSRSINIAPPAGTKTAKWRFYADIVDPNNFLPNEAESYIFIIISKNSEAIKILYYGLVIQHTTTTKYNTI